MSWSISFEEKEKKNPLNADSSNSEHLTKNLMKYFTFGLFGLKDENYATVR